MTYNFRKGLSHLNDSWLVERRVKKLSGNLKNKITTYLNRLDKDPAMIQHYIDMLPQYKTVDRIVHEDEEEEGHILHF